MFKSFSALLLLVAVSGCGSESIERKLISTTPVLVEELTPELHSEQEISVSGATQTAEGGTVIPIHDGTGVIDVVLPESLHIHVGTRLSAQGIVHFDGLTPLLMAEEWHYDSTRVPVHSP